MITFKQTKRYNLPLLLTVLLLFIMAVASAQTTPMPVFRKNLVKINLIPVIPALSGQSQQWAGIEYQRYIMPKLSVSALLNIGLFEDYSFRKYHDFFNQSQGFSYSERTVITRGYHFIPSAQYYFILIRKRPGQGFYAGGNIDFNQYFKNLETYSSLERKSEHSKYRITRLGIGPSAGFQYTFFDRLSFDIELSYYLRIYEHYSIDEELKTPPINAFWKTDEDSMWMTVQFMVGYAFGKHKKTQKKTPVE